MIMTAAQVKTTQRGLLDKRYDTAQILQDIERKIMEAINRNPVSATQIGYRGSFADFHSIDAIPDALRNVLVTLTELGYAWRWSTDGEERLYIIVRW